MNVTRDVILDLLSLCHAGEASDDTRALVAAYAAEDPEIARLLTSPPATALPEPPHALDKENEMQTLEKTTSYMKWNTVFLAGATFLTLLAMMALAFMALAFFLFDGGEGSSQQLLAVAATWGFLIVLMPAVAWTGYFVFRSFYRVGPPAGL